jgi:dienelactone hydrolase
MCRGLSKQVREEQVSFEPVPWPSFSVDEIVGYRLNASIPNRKNGYRLDAELTQKKFLGQLNSFQLAHFHKFRSLIRRVGRRYNHGDITMDHSQLTDAHMQPALSRRSFSHAMVGLSALAVTCTQSLIHAADEPIATLNRFPRMMQDFLVARVREGSSMSFWAKEQLKTKEDAERYVEQVREKIAKSFGPRPEKTDLNARVTGVVERETYRIEKVIFESRPNFPVTANLYFPNLPGKVPGIVGSCGHSENGKAAEAYQSFAQGLARLGYCCLIFDPIGQGERLQYPNDHQKSKYGAGVREHIQAGNQQFLVGEFFGMWRAWDGIRALDYLLSRPEVDPMHVGVTGNSGGGTMTTWLCGVEQRWTMAAPACFVTTFTHNAENELPADTEQCPPHALALGLEHEDFLAALAPKPIVILAKERDYFDVRGSEEAFQRLQHLYGLLGHPENISLHIGPTDHGYSIENREAMYRWFNRVTGVSDAKSEPPITIEKDKTLWCTKSGQVSEQTPTTVFQFTRDKAEVLKTQRGQVAASELPGLIQATLNLHQKLPKNSPPFRILRDIGSRGYSRPRATTYAIESEPGVFAISYLLGMESHQSRPPRKGRQAMLYVSHRSVDAELRSEPWLRDRISGFEGKPVFTCDVRGIGESLPNTCGNNSFDNPYGCDYFYAVHGLMLDRSYLGQKVWDVLRVCQWMKSYGYDKIDLVAKGWGATVATLAAVLSDSMLGRIIQSVTLQQPLESFHSLAVDEDYKMPLAYLPLNVLKHFDLPDCYSALSEKQFDVLK